MPMASAMLNAASDAIEAFAHTLLRAEKDAKAVVAGGAARRSIDVARAKIAEINADLGDMLAANLARGVFLGALVVETGRILDELDAGLAAMTGRGSRIGHRRLEPYFDGRIAGDVQPVTARAAAERRRQYVAGILRRSRSASARSRADQPISPGRRFCVELPDPGRPEQHPVHPGLRRDRGQGDRVRRRTRAARRPPAALPAGR